MRSFIEEFCYSFEYCRGIKNKREKCFSNVWWYESDGPSPEP